MATLSFLLKPFTVDATIQMKWFSHSLLKTPVTTQLQQITQLLENDASIFPHALLGSWVEASNLTIRSWAPLPALKTCRGGGELRIEGESESWRRQAAFLDTVGCKSRSSSQEVDPARAISAMGISGVYCHNWELRQSWCHLILLPQQLQSLWSTFDHISLVIHILWDVLIKPNNHCRKPCIVKECKFKNHKFVEAWTVYMQVTVTLLGPHKNRNRIPSVS